VERLGGEALSHAPALGLMREAAYPVTSLPLVVGDALLLFTDGLYEVEGRDGKQFGFERLQEAVGRRIGLPAGQLLDELVAEARRHAASGEFGDDVCLLEIEFAARIGGAAVHGGNEAR
jgi:sigma-B regulation protein RsbU (phosphoserine phosphatase)